MTLIDAVPCHKKAPWAYTQPFVMTPFSVPNAFLGVDWAMLLTSSSVREEKQHEHKLFGPDFPRTFLTLTPGCPGVKKFLPTTGAAGKCTFWRGRPRFSARTSMTRRVVEKLCTKKVCVDFLPPTFAILGRSCVFSSEGQRADPCVWASLKKHGRANQGSTIKCWRTLLPNISTLAILISPRKSPPNHQNGVPKMNFPEFPGSGFSVDILHKPWISRTFPATPISALWGPHFQRFGGKWSWYVGHCWVLTNT